MILKLGHYTMLGHCPPVSVRDFRQGQDVRIECVGQREDPLMRFVYDGGEKERVRRETVLDGPTHLSVNGVGEKITGSR